MIKWIKKERGIKKYRIKDLYVDYYLCVKYEI
jgi:hypothetical protein